MRDLPQTMAMQQLQGSGAGQMNVLTEIIAAANKDRDIANARIEALENALREIAEWDDNGDQIAGDIARAALAEGQNKAADDELDATIEEMKRRHEEK